MDFYESPYEFDLPNEIDVEPPHGPHSGDPADFVLPEVVITPSDIPPGTTPGAVPFRPDNWNFNLDPAEYVIAGGDTLTGLAITYLGEGARWKELWNMQPQSYRFTHSPDDLNVGQMWPMPQEASDKAKLLSQEIPPGGVTDKPGQAKQAGGGIVAAAVAAGVLFYLLS